MASFWKRLILRVLGLLLFLSLSAFGLVLTLNLTILNPDFIISEINGIDVPRLAEELFQPEIAELAREPGGEFIIRVIDETMTELEAWLKEQLSDGIHTLYDYLTGKRESLHIAIDTEQARDSLETNLREALITSPPPELAGAPTDVIEQYLNEAHQQILEILPPDLEISEGSLPTDILAALEQAKLYIGYILLGYKVLIGLIVALVLGIVILNRRVRSSTRQLGTIFLTYGAFEYAGIFISTRFILPQISLAQIPTSLQAWTSQVVSDFLAPLEIFSLSMLIGGAILLSYRLFTSQSGTRARMAPKR